MKILKRDRIGAAKYDVPPYGVAQAREIGELANSSHPLAGEAVEVVRRIWAGEMTLTEGYRVVKGARNEGETKLLSAQIRAEVVDELHAYSRRHKQLFKNTVAEAIIVFLLASKEIENDRTPETS